MKQEFTFEITNIKTPRTPGASYHIEAKCIESEVIVPGIIPVNRITDKEFIRDTLTKAHEVRLHVNPEYRIKIGDII